MSLRDPIYTYPDVIYGQAVIVKRYPYREPSILQRTWPFPYLKSSLSMYDVYSNIYVTFPTATEESLPLPELTS